MKLFYILYKMGNQCEVLSKQNRNIKEPMSFQNYNQLNFDNFQQFDNPKRHRLSSNFLAHHSCSPNDLQFISSKQFGSFNTTGSSRRFSLIKIDSLVDKQNQPTLDLDDGIRQSIINSKKEKENKLPQNNRIQVSQLKNLSIFRETKNYIVCKKHLYDPIQVKTDQFVSIKHQSPQKYYKLLQKIGQGSFGLVYKAICLKTNQFRAIKMLKQPKKKQKENKNSSKYTQQLKALRILDHPNIIKLYQIFYYEKYYYLVTEYCQGGSILSYLKENRYYSQSIVKAIIKQLLSALSYLHLLKIAHRDVKLQNILFIKKINYQSNVQDVQIKLIDFGESLFMRYPHNNRDSRQIGTVTYMAPQVLDGLYSEKCDIWSCGIIFYTLLTGRGPFRRGSKIQTLSDIKNKQIEFKGSVWNDVPQNIKVLIKKMLQRNPLKRITAKQALKNNWFAQNHQNLPKNKMSEVVKKLYHYYRGNNLVSVVESYLTFIKITQQQKLQITRLFKKIDKDNSGSIDINQLRQAFTLCTDDEHDDEIEYVLKKIDKNKSQKIDLNQFITALYGRKKLFHQNSLELAFSYFDTDEDGYIDKRELRNILSGCDQQEINKILKDIDQNGDEIISKEQFIKYINQQRFL